MKSNGAESSEFEQYIERIRRSRIEITYCEWFDETSDIWCFDLHNHPSVIEMIYFRSGNANINISSKMHSISYYDLIVYPAGAYHQEALSPTVHQDVICIRVRLEDSFNFKEAIHLKDQDQTFNWLFRKIFSEFKKPGSALNLVEDYARLTLLTCVNRHFEADQNSDFVDTVLAYLNDNYSEKISVSGLAEIVHVSEAYLSKCFTKRMHTSIIKHINSLRIERAMHMLIATDFSIDKIAATVGFNSPKYFSRTFRQHTKMTPSEFRFLNR